LFFCYFLEQQLSTHRREQSKLAFLSLLVISVIVLLWITFDFENPLIWFQRINEQQIRKGRE
jgi:hypothetical protein